ncbi:hypothetical protein BGW38_007913, partial [Lunasporangiospora selenospora]
MYPGLKEYLDDSASRDISLVSFMKRFSDIHDKDRIINIWTGAMLYLKRHSSLEKRQLYQSLCKSTTLEIKKIVEKELHEREHDYTLVIHASRQELAASRMHTKQVEERFDTEKSMVTSTTTQTAISTATPSAEMGSIPITERPPAFSSQSHPYQLVEDLDDDKDIGDSAPNPYVARAQASPFYEIVDFIFKKTQGQDLSLPLLPPGLSPVHNEMFCAALKLLRDPGDVSKKKSV